MMAMDSLTTRVCPLLERASRTRTLDVAPSPWVVRQCEETGMVFLENPPGYDSLKQEFAWEVTYEQQAARRKAAEPVLQSVSQVFKRFRRQVLKRHKVADLATAIVSGCEGQPIHLVDIGCGEGDLLGIVMSRLPVAIRDRCRPHGIEISNELARRSQAALAPFGGDCVHAPALQGLASFGADALDLVVMSSFLEHEIQPLPVLREARRALKAGGRVLIKVPNHDCWNRHLRGPRWSGYRWPDHVNYFTPQTLRAMAKAAGMTVERMGLRDRMPTSDSLYAVLRKPVT
jgi:SAM-dependent methyltransferase